MVQTKADRSQSPVNEYILLSLNRHDNSNANAVGSFTSEEEAYGAAIVNLMQHVEDNINQWPKSLILDNQDNITEICRQIKDASSYKSRFENLSSKCQDLFNDQLQIYFQILPIQKNSIQSQSINESLFKIKLRNFLDVFQTRSDIEEDLENSEEDEDEEDEEEEEEEEVYESGEDIDEEEADGAEDANGPDEEDIDEDFEEEDVEEDIEDEDDEEEPRTSETVLHESESEEEGSGLKRKASLLEDEEDEEDEIDEDELDDDDDNTKKRRNA